MNQMSNLLILIRHRFIDKTPKTLLTYLSKVIKLKIKLAAFLCGTNQKKSKYLQSNYSYLKNSPHFAIIVRELGNYSKV